MKSELINLIDYFNLKNLDDLNVIEWSSPIICFGNIENSKIATLGINPSNREFVDLRGIELKNEHRRFHTLYSLGLENWNSYETKHLEKISESCIEYFNRNPYDSWFKKLDYLISGSDSSFYFPISNACHLDLIPYATFKKWSDLTIEQKNSLLDLCVDTLGHLIKNSPIQYLILNGQTVVDNLEKISSVKLFKEHIPEWNLNRKGANNVRGFSYKGVITKIGQVNLNKELTVLGYNHNIQSSFGITLDVMTHIKNWLTKNISI